MPLRLLRQSRRAFTLVEMLTVMAVMALLIGLAGNVMRVDGRAADVNAALDNLGGILHQARFEARSKGTYVWVCLKPVSGSTPGIQVITLASKDGSSDSASVNLTPVAPKSLLPRVALRDVGAATPGRIVNDYTASSVELASASRLGGSTLTITDSAQNTFTDCIVQFDPHGEVSVPGKQLGSFVEVLFAPAASGADTDFKTSAILLSCATGAAQVYR